MAIITTILPPIFTQTGQPLSDLIQFYERLHCAVLDSSFEKLSGQWKDVIVWQRPFAALLAIRRMAQSLLAHPGRWDEYYQGLYFYMVGCLKYNSLYEGQESDPVPAKLAHLTAAIALAFIKQPPTPTALQSSGSSESPQNRQPETFDLNRHLSRPHNRNQPPFTRAADPKILRAILQKRYSVSELKGLCFDLDIEVEELDQSTKSTLIIDLIKHCGRYSMLQQLVDTIPDEIWRLGA